MARKEKPTERVWLGPPSTEGLAPLATAVGSRNGKWKWKEHKLTDKEQRRHDKFQKRTAEADKEGIWRW
jgi:hypothetical protein